MPLTTNIIFDGFTRLWRLRRYLFEKSSITPIYPSSRLCTCKLPTPSKCKLLLWVCSNLLLILLCCVAKLAQNWFMKENTKQLALCFCLRPDHSTLLQLLNTFSRLSVFNMEGPPSVCTRCLKDSGVVKNWQIGRKLLDGRASYKIPQKIWFP